MGNSTTRFGDDHEALRASMRRFVDLMAAGYDAARDALPRERVAFSQLFRQHLAEESAHVRTALPDDAIAAKAAGDMQALLQEYSAHVSHWTPARIDADWDGYRCAVLRLQRRMLVRMAWEERELLPRLRAA
ncbi:MAG: hypothetical protein DI544_11765 [Sphingomonas taxi]|uniref:Hemerythrin-like domain-containing protein n=1 Tax=Sphingomonas taxi TaxID=1549858 RepID=A0A2W5P274_9SPHN|nr:MAG: hypothetical protein DI544_11765 [Sphingomonas taxi]